MVGGITDSTLAVIQALHSLLEGDLNVIWLDSKEVKIKVFVIECPIICTQG